MGLGRMIIVGCFAATAATGGHGVLACELGHAPRSLTAVTPIVAIERKSLKLVTPGPRTRVERRQPVYAPTPFPSRRIILQ